MSRILYLLGSRLRDREDTVWLMDKARYITAIDLSEEMLTKASQKVNTDRVLFIQADITATNWRKSSRLGLAMARLVPKMNPVFRLQLIKGHQSTFWGMMPVNKTIPASTGLVCT